MWDMLLKGSISYLIGMAGETRQRTVPRPPQFSWLGVERGANQPGNEVGGQPLHPANNSGLQRACCLFIPLYHGRSFTDKKNVVMDVRFVPTKSLYILLLIVRRRKPRFFIVSTDVQASSSSRKKNNEDTALSSRRVFQGFENRRTLSCISTRQSLPLKNGDVLRDQEQHVFLLPPVEKLR